MSELSAQRTEELQAYIRLEYPSARRLSRAIGVSEPDDDDSEGGTWLKGLRESFCDNLGYILESVYPEDAAYEIASGAAEEGNTYTLWRVFLDLELYRHVEDDTGESYRLDQMSQMAAIALDAFGRNLFSVLLSAAQDELERLEKQDELERLEEQDEQEEELDGEAEKVTLTVLPSSELPSPDEEIPLMWD